MIKVIDGGEKTNEGDRGRSGRRLAARTDNTLADAESKAWGYPRVRAGLGMRARSRN